MHVSVISVCSSSEGGGGAETSPFQQYTVSRAGRKARGCE